MDERRAGRGDARRSSAARPTSWWPRRSSRAAWTSPTPTRSSSTRPTTTAWPTCTSSAAGSAGTSTGPTAYLLLDADRPVTPNAAQAAQGDRGVHRAGGRLQDRHARPGDPRRGQHPRARSRAGHIAAVGYELYCQLLENAVRQLKNQPLRDAARGDRRPALAGVPAARLRAGPEAADRGLPPAGARARRWSSWTTSARSCATASARCRSRPSGCCAWRSCACWRRGGIVNVHRDCEGHRADVQDRPADPQAGRAERRALPRRGREEPRTTACGRGTRSRCDWMVLRQLLQTGWGEVPPPGGRGSRRAGLSPAPAGASPSPIMPPRLLRTELIWDGKYDAHGKRTTPLRYRPAGSRRSTSRPRTAPRASSVPPTPSSPGATASSGATRSTSCRACCPSSPARSTSSTSTRPSTPAPTSRSPPPSRPTPRPTTTTASPSPSSLASSNRKPTAMPGAAGWIRTCNGSTRRSCCCTSCWQRMGAYMCIWIGMFHIIANVYLTRCSE